MTANESLSKQRRFAFDPREQLVAQKWARKNGLEVIGNAHSHPKGDAVPSKIDCAWNQDNGIMIIIDKSGIIRGWWVANAQNCDPIEVTFLNQSDNN